MAPHDTGILRLLLDKEREERDRRQAQLRALQDRLAHLQSQNDQLQAYRRHYQNHWQLQFRSGSSPAVLQCYQQFVERLDAALAQQSHTLGHVQGLLEQAHHRRLEQEVRVAGVEKLIERQAQRLAQAQSRAQQRSDDEWAQRRARLASPSPLTATL